MLENAEHAQDTFFKASLC